MRVIVIGATGLIGSAVAAALRSNGHDVIAASRRGEVRVDLDHPASLDDVFARYADAAAVVSCAANGPMVDLGSVSDDEFAAGLRGKLIGQVALVRRAIRHLADGGSITLTGGHFAAPMADGSLGALVNAGLEGFVRNAAAELPRGLRINLVAPGWIRETLQAMGEDPAAGTPVEEVAAHYVACVEGGATGRTITPVS